MNINPKLLRLVTLEQKVAVISGGASGIGFATAKRLAGSGASVILVDTNKTKGAKASEEIQKWGGVSRYCFCDVTSSADCKKTAEFVMKEFGRIDILINNAGVIRRKDICELSEKEWDLVCSVNLKSIFLLSRAVIPHMKKNKGGSIINIGSGWGLKGGPKAAAYCAAKGGVVNLTRAMAIDHGKDGIRVNCVCPGDTDTPLLLEEASQLGQNLEEFMKEAASRPLERVGKPEDIANAILFLSSDLSSWITGSILVVDGGGLA